MRIRRKVSKGHLKPQPKTGWQRNIFTGAQPLRHSVPTFPLAPLLISGDLGPRHLFTFELFPRRGRTTAQQPLRCQTHGVEGCDCVPPFHLPSCTSWPQHHAVVHLKRDCATGRRKPATTVLTATYPGNEVRTEDCRTNACVGVQASSRSKRDIVQSLSNKGRSSIVSAVGTLRARK